MKNLNFYICADYFKTQKYLQNLIYMIKLILIFKQKQWKKIGRAHV